MDLTRLHMLAFFVGVAVTAFVLQRVLAPSLPGDDDPGLDAGLGGNLRLLSILMAAGINVLLVMQCGWYLWR